MHIYMHVALALAHAAMLASSCIIGSMCRQLLCMSNWVCFVRPTGNCASTASVDVFTGDICTVGGDLLLQVWCVDMTLFRLICLS